MVWQCAVTLLLWLLLWQRVRVINMLLSLLFGAAFRGDICTFLCDTLTPQGQSKTPRAVLETTGDTESRNRTMAAEAARATALTPKASRIEPRPSTYSTHTDRQPEVGSVGKQAGSASAAHYSLLCWVSGRAEEDAYAAARTTRTKSRQRNQI